MVGFKASVLVAAVAAVGMVAADAPGWSLHELDPSQGITVAGGLSTLLAVESSGLDDCMDQCNDRDNCIGYLYGEWDLSLACSLF